MSQRLGMADGRCFTISAANSLLKNKTSITRIITHIVNSSNSVDQMLLRKLKHSRRAVHAQFPATR